MPGIYFCGAAILTTIFVALWLALPRRRPGALVAATSLAPFGLLGYVFVPTYWRPDQLFEIVPGVGVEDFALCFSEGGIVWLLAGYGNRRNDVAGRPRLPSVASLGRFASLAGAGGALSIVGVALGLATMTAIVLGFTLVGAFLGVRRIDLLPGALAAGLSFAALHVGVGVLVLGVWPEASGFWNPQIATGLQTFGLPIEELAWALTFGACWPMFVQVAFFEVAPETPPAPGARGETLRPFRAE